tara:strand:+ start:148 stop:444 length:297 start_codon:yes stop_codon:yes gene_type:complete
MEEEIIFTEQGWATKSALDAMKKANYQSEKMALFGNINTDTGKQRNNLKWAFVKVGDTQKMCWVDNITNKAYKADGYAQTNIEIKKFTFVRWCTSFDL